MNRKKNDVTDAGLEALLSAAEDRRIPVPSGLGKDLSDMIDSMDAAEKILSSGRNPARRVMTYIMSAAAGIVLLLGIWTAVGTFRAPEDTFTDPEKAYAEVEKALHSISDKMKPALDKAQRAEYTIDKNSRLIQSLYDNK